MSNVVNLTVITAVAGNKTVKPDKDGYYLVTLGGFNLKSHSGEIYSYKGVPEILQDKTNIFNRRLLSARLRSEADHPVREPGMTDPQFVLRNIKIPTQTTCAHIKEIRIKETDISENLAGIGNVVLINALIKPSGPFGEGLKESLDNPLEDTCFSIRCFTKNVITGLQTVKYLLQLVTWDWVNEPGIKYASTMGHPAMEAMDVHSFDIEELNDIVSDLPTSACSTEEQENADAIAELVTAYGETDIVSNW